VNIVAHSLGGIVTRTAIMNGMGDAVNRLILVGSPTEGATLAVVALNDHVVGAAATLAAAIDWVSVSNPIQPSIVQEFSDTLTCLEFAQPASATQMLPTYGWYGHTQAEVEQQQVFIPAPNYVNPFLTNLNAWGLDPRVRYYTIASGTWWSTTNGLQTATYLWGKNWAVPPTGALWQGLTGGSRTAYSAGDGIVPLQSQVASDQAWPIGTGPGQLYRFDQVFGVFHTDYFGTPQVNQDIEQILWHTP
jgi:hypothetical protein